MNYAPSLAPQCLCGCGAVLHLDPLTGETDAWCAGYTEGCYAAHVASLADDDADDFYAGSVPVAAGEQAAQWGGK